MRMGSLHSINVTHEVLTGDWTGNFEATGIDKRPVSGRVRISDHHVEGDRVIDTDVHGGEYKAVYAYAMEDAEFWKSRTTFPIQPGSFGENLSTLGISCTDAVIGERWQIGSTVLQVRQPRMPCRVFAGYWNEKNLIKEFTAVGRPGAYLSIECEGDVGAGDEVILLSRPDHGVTIKDVFRAKTGDRALVPALLEVPELPPTVIEWARTITESSALRPT